MAWTGPDRGAPRDAPGVPVRLTGTAATAGSRVKEGAPALSICEAPLMARELHRELRHIGRCKYPVGAGARGRRHAVGRHHEPARAHQVNTGKGARDTTRLRMR